MNMRKIIIAVALAGAGHGRGANPIARELNLEIATPDEAREILHLRS